MGDGNGGRDKVYRQRSAHRAVRQSRPYEAMVARSTHRRHATQTSRPTLADQAVCLITGRVVLGRHWNNAFSIASL